MVKKIALSWVESLCWINFLALPAGAEILIFFCMEVTVSKNVMFIFY